MERVTEFTIRKTEIPGLLEIDISLIEDARGFFQEKFQKAKLVASGFPQEFNPVQHSISYNKQAGVTRGIHAEPFDKYVSVINGKIFCAYVDLRTGDNFGKKIYLEINPTKAVFVPKGVGNSFQTLVDDVYYTYMYGDYWSSELRDKYKYVNLADPDLAISWPISLDKAIISNKDHNHPMLKNIE